MIQNLLDELRKSKQLGHLACLRIYPGEIHFTLHGISEETEDRLYAYLVEKYAEVIKKVNGMEFGSNGCLVHIFIEEEYHHELP